MSLNCAEIEKITGTFKKNVVIKSIYHSDKNSLVIETYDKSSYYKIFIDTTDRFNHICLLPGDEALVLESLPQGKSLSRKRDAVKKNLRFGQFLNSQFAGSKMKNIYQHELSRIVVFEMEKNSTQFKLVCRLWGTASNVMLLDGDNTIIDSLKRFPKMNEWPSEEFVFPEKNDKSNTYEVRKEFDNDDVNSSIYLHFKSLREKGEHDRIKLKVETFMNKELLILKEQLAKIEKNMSNDYAEEYYKKGELLKANIKKIKKGVKSVMATDYSDNSEVEISISPELGPSENVERYFSKYKKIKDGISRWGIQKKNIEEKIGQYERIFQVLENTDSLEKLTEIHDKIFSGKLSKIADAKNGDKEKTPGRKFILANGYAAYVSKSSKDADKLLTLVASGNDYWFHIRDYAGSHVVVKEIKNSEIPDEVKIEASTLALYYSKGRNSSEGDIYFTRVKYLHKGKNSPSGLVIPTQEKNIKVIFDRNILDKIFARLKEK